MYSEHKDGSKYAILNCAGRSDNVVILMPCSLFVPPLNKTKKTGIMNYPWHLRLCSFKHECAFSNSVFFSSRASIRPFVTRSKDVSNAT